MEISRIRPNGNIKPVPNEKRARHKEQRRAKVAAQRRAEKRQNLLRRAGLSVAIAAVVIGSVIWFNASNNTSLAPTSSTTTSSSVPRSSTTTSSVPIGVTQAQADGIAINHGCKASTAERVNTLSWSNEPAMSISTTKTYRADVVTTAGQFSITLDARSAPHTVNNFVFLARQHFYDCVTFHRVIPGFVVQGGDPLGTGTGGPGYSFKDELPTTPYPLYSVAMANSGADTNGSQFFIVTGPNGESLPRNYSRFGQVTSGQSVVQTIDESGNSDPASGGVPPLVIHRILSVTIHES